VVAIVLSGPQATGKTTLAMALGTALSIPVFSRDPLMQALRTGLPWPVPRHGRWVPATGLRLQTALRAKRQNVMPATSEPGAPVNSGCTVTSRSTGQSQNGSDQDFQLPRQDSNLEPAG
jgi:predicted kinase